MVKRTQTKKEHQIQEDINKLDVVFVVDVTGSMGPFIREAKEKVVSQIRDMSQRGLDIRFGLVEYRDHPPQDNSFTTKTHAFTDNTQKMQTSIELMKAEGGGDRPEAMYCGVAAAIRGLQWRPKADHQIFLIADSPPHTPCLCGLQQFEIIKELNVDSITLNAFSISGEHDTGIHMRALTNATNGLFDEGSVRQSFEHTEHVYAGTASLMNDANTYHTTFTACSSLGSSTTDAAIAKQAGLTLSKIKTAKNYLKKRGLLPKEVTDVSSS